MTDAAGNQKQSRDVCRHQASLSRLLARHRALAVVIPVFVLTIAPLAVSASAPGNDEWLYVWSVKRLLETGHFALLCAVSTSFVPVLAGAVFCKIFGFSFSLLHLYSTLCAALTAFGLYLLLAELRVRRRDAALGAAVFLANPLTINLSCVFMTDLPSICLNTWSAYFLLRALKTPPQPNAVSAGSEEKADRPGSGIFSKSSMFWAISSLICCLSIATRQTAIVFILPAILLAIFYAWRKKSTWIQALLWAVPPLATFFVCLQAMNLVTVYPLGLSGYTGQVLDHLKAVLTSPPAFIKDLTDSTKILSYIGVFLGPLLVLFALNLKPRRLRILPFFTAATAAALLFAFPLFYLVYCTGARMPYSPNLWRPPFVGTYSLIGTLNYWGKAALENVTIMASLLALLLAFSLASGVVLAAKRFFELRQIPEGSVRCLNREAQVGFSIFAFSSFVLLLALVVLQMQVINLDRYHWSLFIPALVCLFCSWRFFSITRLRAVAWILTLCLFGYGLIAAVDYRNFLVCKQNALNSLEASGVNPRCIDGGPDYNMSVNTDLVGRFKKTAEQNGWQKEDRGGDPRNTYRWWPVSGEDYIISFGPLDTYEIVARPKYWSGIKFGLKELLVLKSRHAGELNHH